MDNLIMIGALLETLAFIVVIVYCCIIHGARQDEISQKDYEEFCREENHDERPT